MILTFQSMLKVSAAGARVPEIKARWKALVAQKELNVDGVGLHQLEGRWLTFELRCVAPRAELVARFTALGTAVLELVESWGKVDKTPSSTQLANQGSSPGSLEGAETELILGR